MKTKKILLSPFIATLIMTAPISSFAEEIQETVESDVFVADSVMDKTLTPVDSIQNEAIQTPSSALTMMLADMRSEVILQGADPLISDISDVQEGQDYTFSIRSSEEEPVINYDNFRSVVLTLDFAESSTSGNDVEKMIFTVTDLQINDISFQTENVSYIKSDDDTNNYDNGFSLYDIVKSEKNVDAFNEVFFAAGEEADTGSNTNRNIVSLSVTIHVDELVLKSETTTEETTIEETTTTTEETTITTEEMITTVEITASAITSTTATIMSTTATTATPTTTIAAIVTTKSTSLEEDLPAPTGDNRIPAISLMFCAVSALAASIIITGKRKK